MSHDAPPPIDITVTGGAGGLAANTADIATSAALVGAAAVHLDDARRRSGVIAAAARAAYVQHCLDPSLVTDPLRGIHLRSAADAAELLDAVLATQVSLLRALDQSARSAGEVLDDAEQSLLSGVWSAARTVDGWDVFSPMSFWRTAGAGALSVDGGSVTERVVAGFGSAIGKYNPRRSFLRPPDTADAAGLVHLGASAYGAWTLPWGVRHLPGVRSGAARDLRPGFLTERRTSAAPVTSVAGAMDHIADLPHETVEVQQLTHEDGTVTWAVFVRGTDDLSVGSTSPFSGENNLLLAQGARSPGMELVESAMIQAGIPIGAPVGIYGHSQGGTVAMKLAADPTFRRRYDLVSVATFGSPVAAIVPSQPVPILSIQNQDEVVSSLSGAAPPDFPDRLTIDADFPGAVGSGPTGESAHSLTTHSAVLDAALAQDLPGVAEAVEQQRAVLGEAGVVILPAGAPEAGRHISVAPAEAVTTRFSPPAPPQICLSPPGGEPSTRPPSAPSAPPSPGLTAPTPPTLPDGTLDWAEMSRRSATASMLAGG